MLDNDIVDRDERDQAVKTKSKKLLYLLQERVTGNGDGGGGGDGGVAAA